MIEESLKELSNHPDYQVLKRVPISLIDKKNTENRTFVATIIDLETMGLDATQNEIIEIGLLSFLFSTEDGILAITNSYTELQDPGKPIPAEITKVTGLRDEDVKGKAIDWDFVAQALKNSHLVICHNSRFDRNFLEIQTPEAVQSVAMALPFACTIQDINWNERGFESSKLDYLNWKLGYFYDGHQALNDCWATLNLLIQEQGAFDELKNNVRKKQTIICAENAPFSKKDLLKARKYRWSDGAETLPKGWWSIIDNTLLDDEKSWLDAEIYGVDGKGDDLPQNEITAKSRYSFRAENLG
jgi:DNA polymerase III subunit epsilon